MSNTPTEFDKELEDILTACRKFEITEAEQIRRIKQAVDKYVIGSNMELESVYDFNFPIASSTVKSHNKVYTTVNNTKDEMRETLWGNK